MQAAAVCLPQSPSAAEATSALFGEAAVAQAEGLVPFAALLQGLAPAGDGDARPSGGREELEKLAEGAGADICALLMQLPAGAAGGVGPADTESKGAQGDAAPNAAGIQAALGADGMPCSGAEALLAAPMGRGGTLVPPGAMPGRAETGASGNGGAAGAAYAFQPGGNGVSLADEAVDAIEKALRGALDGDVQPDGQAQPGHSAASGGDGLRAEGLRDAAAEAAGAAPEGKAQAAAQRAQGDLSSRVDEGQKTLSGPEAEGVNAPAAQEEAEIQSGKAPAASAEGKRALGEGAKAKAGGGRDIDEVRRASGDALPEPGVLAGAQDAALLKTGGLTRGEKASAVQRALLRFADDLRGIGGGEREIRVVLEPESLGTLEISVVKTEKGVAAKIRSADREICAAISESLKGLAASLEARGVAVRDLNVEYLSPDFGGGFPQGAGARTGGGSGGGGGRQSERWQDAGSSGGARFLELDVPADADGVSVEYRV